MREVGSAGCGVLRRPLVEGANRPERLRHFPPQLLIVAAVNDAEASRAQLGLKSIATQITQRSGFLGPGCSWIGTGRRAG